MYSTDEPHASFLFSNEMVTLALDEGKIAVHNEVLMQSAYFQRWLTPMEQTPGAKGVLHIQGYKKATGIEMANWLYSATSSSFTSDTLNTTGTEAVERGWRLVDAYRLARDTELEEWQNHLADAFLEIADQDVPWMRYLQRLCTPEEPDTGLVGLLFTALARDIRRHGWEEYMNKIETSLVKALHGNGKFATRLMKRVLESEGVSEKSFKATSCKWHIHNHTPQCAGI